MTADQATPTRRRKRDTAIAPTVAPDVADPPQAPPQPVPPAFPRDLRQVQVLALIFTALLLVPSGAHFFALFNKMALDRETYMAVQGIYRGWAFFGFAVVTALLLTALHIVMVCRDRAVLIWALAVLAAIVLTQITSGPGHIPPTP